MAWILDKISESKSLYRWPEDVCRVEQREVAEAFQEGTRRFQRSFKKSQGYFSRVSNSFRRFQEPHGHCMLSVGVSGEFHRVSRMFQGLSGSFMGGIPGDPHSFQRPNFAITIILDLKSWFKSFSVFEEVVWFVEALFFEKITYVFVSPEIR